jgi:micrococcal nuclease
MNQEQGMRFDREAVGIGPVGFAAITAALLFAWGARTVAEEKQAEPSPPAAPPATPAYWQAQALPQAVIQGGAIPPGWQPQAVPYQGIGPDGQPLTMYFAPTYVFTYQAGPPVPAAPQINRRRWWGSQPAATMPPPVAGGWNYATSGAPPVTTTLPPGGVTQYRSAYRFPPDARALQGTELAPPGPLPEPPSLPTEAWAATAPSGQAPAGPPAYQPPPLSPPPTQWVPSQPPPPAAGLPPAAMGVTAGMAAAAPPPPPPPPVQIQPLEPPPPATPLNRHVWRVVGVSDGDTITCLDEAGQQQKVQLAGVDAPATSQSYGRQSREALAGMVFGRVVEVVDQGRDAGGVVQARVFVGVSDVNLEMVATGNAWADSATGDPSLTAAQAKASSQQLGLWAPAAGDQR